MENTTYNYKIYHKEVTPTEIVLTHQPECGAVVPTWWIGAIASIIIAVTASSWFVFIICIGITYGLTRVFQQQRNDEEKATIAKNTTQQNVNTAQNVSNQLNNMLKVSTGLVQELPNLLNKASASLERAREEFSSNAFSPYWDCIEQATRHLATFNNNIQQIRNYADQYYSVLKDKKHNFPSFFPEREVFPDMVPVISELNTVVRPGLTNFQFATIWEHRKTQNILIQGFSTLGDAISNMAASISSSISQLHDTISSNTTQLIDQQTMSQESFERYSSSHAGLMEDQIKRLENIDRKIKEPKA